MNIFDYWWIWDVLANEQAENWGSVIIGYIAFCVILVTFSPVPALSWWFRHKNIAVYSSLVLLWLAASVWILLTIQIHEIWNVYQAWYTKPLGPGI